MKYYQGETIEATIQSDDLVLENVDFSIWIYRDRGCPIVINKSQMNFTNEGTYKLVIGSEVTAEMPSGRYNIEIVVADDTVIIGRAIAFELICSVSKGGLCYE